MFLNQIENDGTLKTRVKFIVDGMHGTLARKLRIYGFDTIFDPKADDEALLEVGREEGRALITSDRGLHRAALKNEIKSILLTGETDEDRMTTLFRRLKMTVSTLNPEISRCPMCNGMLKPIERPSLRGRIPEGVLQRKDEFYICPSCGKVYWEGSHWRRIRAFAKRVERRLQV